MSRPRKPYGPNPPGRLLGTMIKVLAAEMSDQARLARGKRYWSDDAVVDIVVGHGAVTAEVQGSRRQPYVVTIEANGGDAVPGRREIWAQCTCPDDTGTGLDLCKHAVAAMFALADEVTIEPELVDRWRAGRRTGRSAADATDPAESASVTGAADVTLLPTSAADDGGDGRDDDRHGEDDHGDDGDVGDDGAGAEVIELRPRIETDVISRLLRAPDGGAGPTFPDVTELAHRPMRDRLLADVLDDALDHLAIRWE